MTTGLFWISSGALGDHLAENQGLDHLAELHDHLDPVLDQEDGQPELGAPGG
jgi:hypothetical protein